MRRKGIGIVLLFAVISASAPRVRASAPVPPPDCSCEASCCGSEASGRPLNRKISIMGSSVPYGSGAADNKGYTYFFSTYLAPEWTVSNICIPGNNTLDLLSRYGDLTADGADFVLFALSLGNEGIHGAANQEAVYRQWKDNMLELVARARADGKRVAVTGNYARGDFNGSDYAWTRRLNLDIQGWDLPSVNLLGSIDDGEGHWADGYQNGDDAYHPNTEGHREMSYTLVPSMFDAMAQGKPLPRRDRGGSLVLEGSIGLKPEGTVHSFSTAIGIKSDLADTSIIEADGIKLELKGGRLVLGDIISPGKVNDGAWHELFLTHYHARGITLLYLDGELIGSREEKLVPGSFRYGQKGLCIREIQFWRSGMNADEAAALYNGALLKSSLEIYAPLRGGSLENLATSTNTLTRQQ